jgi:hypothetical protein
MGPAHRRTTSFNYNSAFHKTFKPQMNADKRKYSNLLSLQRLSAFISGS